MRVRRRVQCLAVLVATLAATGPAWAVQPDEVLSNPALESRARELSKELRCMVCQNQSIDDSDAPLARDLRLLVRERLVAGDSDNQVIDFLVARYGEFVLLRPRLAWRTVVLWLAPLVALLAGALGIWLTLRRRGPRAATAPEQPQRLSPDEEKRVRDLMENDADLSRS
jgi:cytochrome c-type biogenesis protein CcmH